MLRQLANLLQAAAPTPTKVASNGTAESEAESETAVQVGHQEAALLVEAALDRIYRRLPHAANSKKGIPPERCPWTGLTRNQFYELFERREDGQPLIKNVSLREDDEARAARLYNVGSALRYLDRLAEQQARELNR